MTVVPSLDVVPGGNGLNTAVAAARVGVATGVAGVLGDDLFGRHLENFLVTERVDTSLLTLLPKRTSPTTIIINDATGERSFIHHPGTNAEFRVPTAQIARSARIVHFAAPQLLGPFWPDACIEAARAAREAGATVSADIIFADAPSPDLVNTHRPFLELCDIALPNEDEARMVTGQKTTADAARYLHDHGIRIVAIKRGADGAVVSTGEGSIEVPTERVDAVDTCGAGDNFAGGFLAAHLRGLEPVECTRIGCALGTRCVQFRGSLTGTSDRQFLERIRQGLET